MVWITLASSGLYFFTINILHSMLFESLYPGQNLSQRRYTALPCFVGEKLVIQSFNFLGSSISFQNWPFVAHKINGQGMKTHGTKKEEKVGLNQEQEN